MNKPVENPPLVQEAARPARIRRPLSVTFTTCLVLCIAGFNWLRLILSISNWAFLKGLLPFSPVYLAVTGLAWGLVGLAVAWGLWRGRPWALPAAGLGFAAYSVYYWSDRLVMPGYAYRNADWPFWLVINLLLLAWGLWVSTHPRTKSFFGGNNERRPESHRAT